MLPQTTARIVDAFAEVNLRMTRGEKTKFILKNNQQYQACDSERYQLLQALMWHGENVKEFRTLTIFEIAKLYFNIYDN